MKLDQLYSITYSIILLINVLLRIYVEACATVAMKGAGELFLLLTHQWWLALRLVLWYCTAWACSSVFYNEVCNATGLCQFYAVNL